MSPQTSPLTETYNYTLPVGKRVLFVGLNPQAGNGALLRAGSVDRVHNMDIGTVKSARELPYRNFSIAIVNGLNGKMATEVQDKIQALTDRGGVEYLLIAQDAKPIIAMLEATNFASKGEIAFELSGVMHHFELHKSNNPPVKKGAGGASGNAPPPGPPGPPDAPPPVDTAPPPGPPVPPDPGPPPPPRLSADEAAALLPELCRTIEKPADVIRELRRRGLSDNALSDASLYGRIAKFKPPRSRRVRDSGQSAVVPQELLSSESGSQLLGKIEALMQLQVEHQKAQSALFDQVVQFAGQVATENAELKKAVASTKTELDELGAIKVRAQDVLGKLNRFLAAAGQPAATL